MVTLRRVGVRSAGKLGFWFGVCLAFINTVILFIVLILVLRVPLPALLESDFIFNSLFLMFAAGINSAITFGTAASIYNFIAKRQGGLQLEFDAIDTPANKRKNDEDDDMPRRRRMRRMDDDDTSDDATIV